MKAMHKIVIKVGTSALTQGTQKLSRRYMLSLSQQLAQLQDKGVQVVLVSSGAVATGRELLHSSKQGAHSKQMLASIGQAKLMQVWSELFSLLGLQLGQVLLTTDDFSEQKKDQIRTTLSCMLDHLVIPIINENDTTVLDGIRVGDNDNLAALVADVISADTVILLTDQEGLYTADPRLEPQAKLISVVTEINEAIFAIAKGSSSSLGTGGMTTKIEAAQKASHCGVRTIIASSSRSNVLLDLLEGMQIGTMFLEQAQV